MPLPKMRGMRGGQGLKGTVGQASVQQPTQGKLRTANAAKRNTTSGRSLGPGLLPHAVDTDVVIRQRANVPHPTQASEYIGLQIQVQIWLPQSGMPHSILGNGRPTSAAYGLALMFAAAGAQLADKCTHYFPSPGPPQAPAERCSSAPAARALYEGQAPRQP